MCGTATPDGRVHPPLLLRKRRRARLHRIGVRVSGGSMRQAETWGTDVTVNANIEGLPL